MEIGKKISVNYSYLYKTMQVLEWHLDESGAEKLEGEIKEGKKVEWDLSCEIMMQPTGEEKHHMVTIDLWLGIKPESGGTPPVSIRTRHRTGVYKLDIEQITSNILCQFLNYHLALVRGYVATALEEEMVSLPVIPLYSPEELFDIASLSSYHLNLYEFSYYRRKLHQPISLPNNIVATICQESTQYFLPYQPSVLDNIDEEKYILTWAIANDYETSDFFNWVLNVDVKLEVKPVGNFLYRKSYAFQAHEKDFVNNEFYEVIIADAWKNSYPTFLENCQQYKVENLLESLPISEKTVAAKAEDFRSEYFRYVKPNLQQNSSSWIEQGLTLTKGDNTVLKVKLTFAIMDEILYLNPNFNHEHNQDAISANNVPYVIYFTLKHRCLGITEGKIKLSWLHTFMFYQCLDLALKILLSDQGELLQESLLKRNFTDLRQKEYIKFGSDFIKTLKNSLKKDGAEINVINEPVDWAAIIC